MPELRMIPYEMLVEPPFPMREQFGDMPFQELVESIGAHGVKQPLLVRPVNGHFEIMAGHRRYKASGACGLRELPCLVEECDDEKAVDTMLAENSGREDVTATEEGRWYLSLMERFNLDEAALCRKLKKSESYIAERIALVQCDDEIANAVLNKLINFSVAKELLRVNPYTAALVLRCPVEQLDEERVKNIERQRKSFLDICVRSGATARVAHSYVEQWKTWQLPNNPYPAQGTNGNESAQTVVQMPRCLICGRDADPQNMRELRIHFWELDKVKTVLREAGFVLYE
jgi:ParB family chromosome partitioning protein